MERLALLSAQKCAHTARRVREKRFAKRMRASERRTRAKVA